MTPHCPRCGGDQFLRIDNGTNCAACQLHFTPSLTVAEAAEFAGVSTRTVSSWIAHDLLAAVGDGKFKRIALHHVMQLIYDRSLSGGKLSTRLLDKVQSHFR